MKRKIKERAAVIRLSSNVAAAKTIETIRAVLLASAIESLRGGGGLRVELPQFSADVLCHEPVAMAFGDFKRLQVALAAGWFTHGANLALPQRLSRYQLAISGAHASK